MAIVITLVKEIKRNKLMIVNVTMMMIIMI